jgi:hypothetical protein
MLSTKKAEAGGELLYPMPDVLPALKAVRGSILLLDWRWLREISLFEKYESALADRALLATMASDWVPIALAARHWGALDALGLPATTIAEAGHFVGSHVHGAFLRTLVRLAGSLGTSPWAALGQSQKLWERSWRGGGLVIRRVGQLSARLDVVNASVVSASPFFRASFRGAVAEGIAPFCARPVVVELEELRTSSSFAMRASWH